MSAPVCTSLVNAVAHAVNFLTAPLAASQHPATINQLQIVLEASLIALYQPSWFPTDPSSGSRRRCLSLSPNSLPPRPIYAACIAAGIQWFDWIATLGSVDFDLLVDPGMVRVRLGTKGTPSYELITIWAERLQARVFPTAFTTPKLSIVRSHSQHRAHGAAPSKTLAQQLIEDDHEEDEILFSMLADEVSAPTWVTPTVENFPVPAHRSDTPLSFISTHSRSSSRSSNSSSGFSFASGNTSLTSLSTTSSSPEKSASKQSRREKVKTAHVFIDNTKTEVTPYDGGKTTVLTGGVMLGGAPTPKKAISRPVPQSLPLAWRRF